MSKEDLRRAVGKLWAYRHAKIEEMGEEIRHYVCSRSADGSLTDCPLSLISTDDLGHLSGRIRGELLRRENIERGRLVDDLPTGVVTFVHNGVVISEMEFVDLLNAGGCRVVVETEPVRNWVWDKWRSGTGSVPLRDLLSPEWRTWLNGIPLKKAVNKIVLDGDILTFECKLK